MSISHSTAFYCINIITVEQCTDFKATWTNIQLAETDFPVFKNTAVTLNCQEGFQIAGDTIVTCFGGTEFTYGTEPSCGNDSCDREHQRKSSISKK